MPFGGSCDKSLGKAGKVLRIRSASLKNKDAAAHEGISAGPCNTDAKEVGSQTVVMHAHGKVVQVLS